MRPGPAAVISMTIVAMTMAVGAIAWRRRWRGLADSADAPSSRSSPSSRAQRRERLRQQRRHQRDQRRLRAKQQRGTERERRQELMTDDAKLEEIARIRMQRVEQYQKLDASLDATAPGRLRVVVDLAFAETQTTREQHSILKQLGCAYGYMKRCPLDRVVSLQVVSCAGPVAAIAQQHGLPRWKIRADAAPLEALYDPTELVYLSPDAPEALTTVDPTRVYVLGAIVDRSVRKGESLARATAQRIETRRLPLHEFCDAVHKPVLNLDAVIVVLNEAFNHGDWARALAVAVPKRMARPAIDRGTQRDHEKSK